MNPFKLSSFKPSLQIQLILAALFRLQTTLKSHPFAPSFSLLVKLDGHATPWQENSGILHQLKFQVNHLLNARSHELLSKLEQTLDMAIEECRLKAFDETIPDNCAWPQILFNLTAEYLHGCEPDENLYYFLLRHQDECKKTFGRVFLLSLFKKKHKGLKQTEEFLVTRYDERGFFHLKPSIRQYLAGLTKC